MIAFRSRMDVKSVDDVFAEINARQIAALMMHDQMADYFDFLGLSGYKRLHLYQYFAESKERRDVAHYYINHHGKLIPDRFEGNVQMIPESWRSANRMSVGKSTKQKAVEDGFSVYLGWEQATKDVYQKYATALREQGYVADAIFVDRLVEDVDNELERLERIITDLITSGYDPVYILESQKELHDKYKKKMRGGVKHGSAD
nr:MAG TPA: ferritin non-heme ferritin, H-chain like.7A [Caudoviricetes sp.]